MCLMKNEEIERKIDNMHLKNLSDSKRGQTGKIHTISGETRFLNRIISIGLTIGSELEVIQNNRKQPILVFGRDTIIAINRNEGERIVLEVTE